MRLAVILAILLSGCATAEPAPYLATYRPLQPKPGEEIVSLTAALGGRLAVVGGCFAVVGDGGAATLPAFGPQVRVTRSGGRYGLVDTETGSRVFVGDSIGAGGGSPPDARVFARERLVSPPPEGCPTYVFVSNGGFGAR